METKVKPTKTHVKQLVKDMRSGALQFQTAVIEFIKVRGWSVLGHDTFEKFWIEEMSDIKIAAELQAPVVWALYAENVLPEDVADIVKGVGNKKADMWKDEFDAGAPAEKASRRGRSTGLSDPLPTETLFLHLPRSMMRTLRMVSASHEITPEQLGVAAIKSLLEGFSGG